MSFSISNRQPISFIGRIAEYEGEKWKVMNMGKETVSLDFVNVPGEPRDDRLLLMPRKLFFECLIPRTRG